MQAVQIGMDRKDRERELVSALLSSLHRTTISQEEMAKGFTRLLLFTEVQLTAHKSAATTQGGVDTPYACSGCTAQGGLRGLLGFSTGFVTGW